MSHRKYNEPRRGTLAFLPRGRSRYIRGRIKSFPKDNENLQPHLTAFLGFKAGMTHVVRDAIRPGSRIHKKEVVDAVTIIETPPMVGIAVIGYHETPNGLQAVTTAWASIVSNEVKRNYYSKWIVSKPHKAFANLAEKNQKGELENRLKQLKAEATVIRLVAHTQQQGLAIGRKKAFIAEIQVNGGNIAAKVDFAASFLEKPISIDTVFAEGEQIDSIGNTKGKGWEGVIHRYGAKRLQKKTHRGRRKIACIGPWNPKRISWAVGRGGQMGYHHRVEINKRIYRIGAAAAEGVVNETGSTSYDLTKKAITPLGGFPHYGTIKNQFLMIKGCIQGPPRRCITLRKTIFTNSKRIATEELNLKWIDTASKIGHGRFQTHEEKVKFYGKLKPKVKPE